MLKWLVSFLVLFLCFEHLAYLYQSYHYGDFGNENSDNVFRYLNKMNSLFLGRCSNSYIGQ